MSTTVPKLIQRFRARELQKLVKAGGYLHPPSTSRPTFKFMENTDVTNVRMGTPLRNPFLPHPTPIKPSRLSSGDQKKQRRTWMGPQYSLRRQADLVKAARASGTVHLLPPGPKLSVEELEAAKKEYRLRAAKAKATSARVEEAILSKTQVTESGSQQQQVTKSSAAPTLKGKPWRRRSKATLIRRRNSAALGYPGVVFRWMGKVPVKKRVGLTFYAGRRRMFKGHKWERQMEKRKGQIAVRMRDMGARIARFKNVYKRRRPQPLKPAPTRKKESLPF